jgi:hypothetical protein
MNALYLQAASLLFIRIITVMLFLGGDLYSFLFFIKLVFVSFCGPGFGELYLVFVIIS